MGGFPHYNGFYLPLFGDNGEMAQNYFSWVKNGSQGDKLFFIWGGGVLGLQISDFASWMGSLTILSCLLETWYEGRK